MDRAPKLSRMDQRFHRSKRSGKIILGGVVLVSLVFGVALVQGLLVALEAGRNDLVMRALVGLSLLVGLNLFSVVLIRRQHRMLDEARDGLEALVRGDPQI
jgi:exosortase/archaeosortase